MSTRLLYVATLIWTSCTMFFHFSEYRCPPNIRLNAGNTISASHLYGNPAIDFTTARAANSDPACWNGAPALFLFTAAMARGGYVTMLPRPDIVTYELPISRMISSIVFRMRPGGTAGPNRSVVDRVSLQSLDDATICRSISFTVWEYMPLGHTRAQGSVY